MQQVNRGKHINTIVGGVVVSTIIAVFVSFVLFSSGVSFESYTDYMVYMQEAVTGLSPDSPVEYNGVEVGSVKEIKIDRRNPYYVKLLLSIKKSTLITVDTVATLKAKGLTGVSYISLSIEGNELTPLLPKPGERYAIIPTTPSFSVQLDAIVAHLNRVISDVKGSFQALLDKDDLETLRETYYSIDHIIAVFNANADNLNIIIVNIHTSMLDFSQFTRYKDNLYKIMKIQVIPYATELLDNFRIIFTTLKEATSAIKKQPAMVILGTMPPQPGPGEKPFSVPKRDAKKCV